ncbi:kinase-like domain-containing protein [Aspergillus stella-maris]|uniref:kinase-like domain-containing protein n=1 Tax=Aspergillus stella-maris TaxID=1810926 RepID=UPI003CCD1EC4
MAHYIFPPGISAEDIKGCGTSGMAALDPSTGYILKFHLGDDDERERCETEREIYEQLEKSRYERPSSLLKFYGSTKHGILLENAEHGPVRKDLRQSRSAKTIDKTTVFWWARQATEAVQFVHANGIHHGDVNCTNFFVDGNLDLKLGDFTSSVNDLAVTAEDLREDILNIGAALYELGTGHLPSPNF